MDAASPRLPDDIGALRLALMLAEARAGEAEARAATVEARLAVAQAERSDIDAQITYLKLETLEAQAAAIRDEVGAHRAADRSDGA